MKEEVTNEENGAAFSTVTTLPFTGFLTLVIKMEPLSPTSSPQMQKNQQPIPQVKIEPRSPTSSTPTKKCERPILRLKTEPLSPTSSTPIKNNERPGANEEDDMLSL